MTLKPTPAGRDGAEGAAIGAASAELESIMRELIDCYGKMETLAGLRADAIRGADPARLGACIGEENEVVQRVADIEKRRVAVVGSLAARLGSAEKSRTRVSWIAGRLGGAAGERLASLAVELRDRIERVTRLNEAASSAASMLAGHIDGLIKAVAASLNHAKTYGRRGVVAPGARVTSALDVVS